MVQAGYSKTGVAGPGRQGACADVPANSPQTLGQVLADVSVTQTRGSAVHATPALRQGAAGAKRDKAVTPQCTFMCMFVWLAGSAIFDICFH